MTAARITCIPSAKVRTIRTKTQPYEDTGKIGTS